MGSSVSSERAFSAAGITISKRQNRLKADIVEALEFLKCMYIKDLIYREPAPSSVLEDELEVLDDNGDPDWEDEEEIQAWDAFVTDMEEGRSHSPIFFLFLLNVLTFSPCSHYEPTFSATPSPSL